MIAFVLLALEGCQLAYSTRRIEGGRELVYAIPEDRAFAIARSALQEGAQGPVSEVVKEPLRFSTRGFASGSLIGGTFEVSPLRFRGVDDGGRPVTGYSVQVVSRGGGLEQGNRTRAIIKRASALLEETDAGIWVSGAERVDYESSGHAGPAEEPAPGAGAAAAARAPAACFVVRRDGVILTAGQAVSGASSVRVRLSDGKWHEAKVESSSEDLGLALLRIDARTPKFLPLAADSSPRANDTVLGFHLSGGERPGAEGSVVRGTVLQVTRGGLRVSWPSGEATPGSPLLDESGRVIAIDAPAGAGDRAPGEAVAAHDAQRLFRRPLAIERSAKPEEAMRRARDALCWVAAAEAAPAR